MPTRFRALLILWAVLSVVSPRAQAGFCIAGSSSTTGSTPCVSCAPGTFQPLPGQTSCTACAAGSFQDQSGATTCSGCGIGHFQNQTGQTTCPLCLPGSYQDQLNQSSCNQCAAGQFQSSAGASTCFNCLPETVSAPGSFACTADGPSTTVSSAKAYPNPFRPSQGHSVITIKALPANARVRVYNAKGSLVKDLSSDALGFAYWDATNQSGSPAVSGVYYVYAQGAGVSRTLKVAIQR
jgi:hypothetical protein